MILYASHHGLADITSLRCQHYDASLLRIGIDILNIFQIVLVVPFGILSTPDDFLSPILVARLLRSVTIPTAIPTRISRIAVETFIVGIVPIFGGSSATVIRLRRFEIVPVADGRCRILSGASLATGLAVVAGGTSTNNRRRKIKR